MNDSIADAPRSIFTPPSQRLPTPTDPRLPLVVSRTSSPFSRRRRTISGALSLEKESSHPTLGKTIVGHNTSDFAAPPAPLGCGARVFRQDNRSLAAGTGQRTRPSSIACSPPGIDISASAPRELQPALEVGVLTGARKKRPSDVQTPDASNPKRPRIKPRLNYSLDGLQFDGPARQPPSPLFFSNTQRARPKFPPRLTSSEAAARMLSKARHEEVHVKTVSLARGTIPTPAPGSHFATSTPTNASRQSLDRSSTTTSDSPTGSYSGRNPGSSPGQNLNTIGIVELFEEDQRPTFIIDLSDSTNYGLGVLSPLYANSSLRSYEGLYELISGFPNKASSASESFTRFKSWALASMSGEGLNSYLPTYQYASILWSCSTIRKKLRVIGGTFLSSPGYQNGPASSTPPQSAGTATMGPTSAPSEATDYFGAPSNISTVAVPSIEGFARTIALPSASEGNTGIADQQTPTDEISSPSTYVLDGMPLTPAVPAVTNVNWFYSHVQAHSMSPSFDWTRLPVSDAMPSHIRFARSIDWAATSLGHIDTWGPDLRQMCNLIMGMLFRGGKSVCLRLC